MTGRERIRTIFSGRTADRCGFWLGNPHPDTWPLYKQAFGTESEEEIRVMLGDDLRWIPGESGGYHDPDGRPMFDIHPKGPGLSSATLFADCEDLAEIEACAWPNPEYLDVDACVRMLEATGPFYRAGGCWSPFFHIVADFFGMEAYFVKMYTHPEIVHAVTRRVVDFYLGANRRLYSRAGDLIDGFFFGNDFGTQLDLLISPDCFREFVFPYFRELTEQAKAHGYQVILHSCGSIHRVIPDLIGMGVEALHPLQARAANMDAETLRRDFHGKVAFLGGIDTQDLLVNGSPDAVRTDVRRVRELLEPALVVSPSHECLLPNVSAANVRAMAEAALAGD